MHNGNTATPRRSSRVSTSVPILVSSSDGAQFSECETVVVNAHGGAMLSRVKFESGASLRLHNKEGGKTTARVVSCQPFGSDNQSWTVAATLDRPGNFWGVKDCPKDWTLPTRFVTLRSPRPVPHTTAVTPSPVQLNPASEAMLSQVSSQVEAQVQKMIAESLRPLHAEITAIREKLQRREANPSKFQVSLTSIPPELEQQLELRLRKALGPKVVDEAHQQSAQLLSSAKAAIEKRTADCYEEFRQRVAAEFNSVQKQSKEISATVSARAQQDVNRGLEEFQQKLLDGGNSLKRLTEELLDYLQRNVNEEHNARRADLEDLRASVSSESSRLHERIEQLDRRIARLGESATCLESGLTQRLSQMASNTIKDARTQLQDVANDIAEEFATRSGAALGNQLEEATANMKILQKGIIASSADSLKLQAENALQSFEHSMEELAAGCAGRVHHKLVSALNVLVKSVGEQFQPVDKPE